jgi:uncharacterized protein (DUF1697 family)
MIQVALLRGINVGGSHKVPMSDLKRVFQEVGLTEVVTYINSGNVVFEAPQQSELELAVSLEDTLESEFGFRPRVLVRSGQDIRAIADAIPPDWTNGPQMKADVVYLLDGVDPAAASRQLDPREGVEHVIFAPGAFIWMVSRPDATRSRLQSMVGTPLYQQATVRNVNTARKLAALVAARDS